MKLHVVITRFIEPWEYVWEIYAMCERALQGHEYDFIVYHRGGEAQAWTAQTPPNVQIIPLENVGRESFVVHHHICKHYHQLPDRIIFIPANWRSREFGVKHVLYNIHPNGFFPPPAYVPWSSEQFFQLDKWHGLTEVNRSEVLKQEYTNASIRPYGQWYKARIPVPYKDLLVLNGVISIPQQSILRYPLAMYEGWLAELQQSGPNPEIGHYWERTWYSLFS
jgi:hypothetical protein